MPLILYPGVMQPGGVVDVNLLDIAFTEFPTGDQIDRSDPDPDPFEYSFYPGDIIIPVDPTVDVPQTDFPAGNQIDCSDPDPDPFEYAFEPWTEIAVAAVIYDPSMDVAVPDVDADEQPDSPSIFEPIDTDIPAPDFDPYIQPQDEKLPQSDSIFDSGLVEIIVPDFDTAPSIQDDDAPSTESSFSPDVLDVLIQPPDFDAPVTEDEEPFDQQSSFDGVDTLDNLLAGIDFSDAFFEEEPTHVEAITSFEPWIEVVVTTLIDFPENRWDVANDPNEPIFDSNFEPVPIVPTPPARTVIEAKTILGVSGTADVNYANHQVGIQTGVH